MSREEADAEIASVLTQLEQLMSVIRSNVAQLQSILTDTGVAGDQSARA